MHAGAAHRLRVRRRHHHAPLPFSFKLTFYSRALSAFYRCAQRAKVVGRQLLVDGEPFLVRGMCYSPIPINESVYFAPYGDYFSADYSFIWLRDLPAIKAMGANVLRIYGWQPDTDHTAFLDAAYNAGLYVMATFYMGDETETPVSTASDRRAVIKTFTAEVAKYSDHPSLLFWSFGNELNGVWNGFLQSLGKDPERKECGWDDRYDDLGGCWIHKRGTPWIPGDVSSMQPSSSSHAAAAAAAAAAKQQPSSSTTTTLTHPQPFPLSLSLAVAGVL